VEWRGVGGEEWVEKWRGVGRKVERSG